MAKYDVTFSCGHSEIMRLFGPAYERERRLDYFARAALCEACRIEARQRAKSDATAHAASVAQAEGYPVLLGTEKQIAWAVTLRQEAMRVLTSLRNRGIESERERLNRIVDLVSAWLLGFTESKWWIERRPSESDVTNMVFSGEGLPADLVAQRELMVIGVQ